MAAFLWIDRSESAQRAERDHLVGRVVADIGAAEIGDSVAFAPVPGDGFRAFAEVGIVRLHVADPAEPYSRAPLHRRAGGDVEQRPVGRVHMPDTSSSS